MTDLKSVACPLPALPAGAPGADVTLEDGAIRRTILPGGTRVITEHMLGTRAATVALWVARGSRDEVEGARGSTHFLEHLLFKGTPRRTAHQIAMEFDAVGGDSNAATGRECTHYYAEVLGEDVPMAIDVLMDMLCAPLLNAADFEMERGIILDELTMALDNPSEQAFDEFTRRVFPAHPLGRPIGGTIESVKADTLEAIVAHYQAGYAPDRLVVAAAGDISHDQVCELVARALRRPDSPWPQWQSAPDPAQPALDFNTVAAVPLGSPADRCGNSLNAAGQGAWKPESGVFQIAGKFEQSRIIIGGPGPGVADANMPVMNVLNTVLGGGMSSRLFQNIREKRGLAYTTYAFNSSHRDAGSFGVTATCNPANVDEVAALLRAELEEIATNPIPADELARAKGQLRGATLLSLEDNTVRANRLAHAEILRGAYIPLATKLDQMQAVTAAQVRDWAVELAKRATIEVRLGPGE